MGDGYFFRQMAQICGALNLTVVDEQKSGKLPVDSLDGLNWRDLEETE